MDWNKAQALPAPPVSKRNPHSQTESSATSERKNSGLPLEQLLSLIARSRSRRNKPLRPHQNPLLADLLVIGADFNRQVHNAGQKRRRLSRLFFVATCPFSHARPPLTPEGKPNNPHGPRENEKTHGKRGLIHRPLSGRVLRWLSGNSQLLIRQNLTPRASV